MSSSSIASRYYLPDRSYTGAYIVEERPILGRLYQLQFLVFYLYLIYCFLIVYVTPRPKPSKQPPPAVVSREVVSSTPRYGFGHGQLTDSPPALRVYERRTASPVLRRRLRWGLEVD